jgi:AI-2 transport protein TqsA
MTIQTHPGSALRIALGLAAFIIIIAGMKAAVGLIVPFLLAAFIAIICAPAINWLKAKGVPMGVALGIVIASVALFGSLIVSIIGGSIHSFTGQLPEYQKILHGYIESLSGWLSQRGLTWYDDELKNAINPAGVLKFIGGVFNSLGNLLANGFLIFLTVVFLLFEGSSFPAKMKLMASDTDLHMQRLQEFLANVNKYMAIKTITSLATGIAISLWLAILGVDYALLWGLLAFLLNYIPNIGSIIAAVPALLLALISSGPGTALWAAAGYLVVNIVVGNVVEPKFLGNRLGLSTLVVFISLVFWGWVLGTVGMFLSVPLTMVLKLALEARDETRWIAILLGTGHEAVQQSSEAV